MTVGNTVDRETVKYPPPLVEIHLDMLIWATMS
jgi:hypothetical protein